VKLTSKIFSKTTFVNLDFVQMMAFDYFKKRVQEQAIVKHGDINEKDHLNIVEATKIYPMPPDPRREEWQAILLLLRSDLRIDVT